MTPAAIQPVSFDLGEADFPAFAQALGASFARHGFAVVRDHGLSERLTEGMMADSKSLFSLTESAKRRYLVTGGAGQRGYTPFAVETAKDATRPDLKEFWHVGRGDNLWPAEVPTFQAHALGLFAALEALGERLLAAIGVYLRLEPGQLESAAREGNSVLRLLHYPSADFESGSLRASPHEDINAITLLLGAEEAGLEILDRGGAWLAINPPPGAVVVNIGDMLARLTNDVLPSTTHRVVNPAVERRGVARYSMPFFLHFRSDFVIDTLPSCVTADRPNLYPTPIRAADFLSQRLREIGLA